MKTIHDHPTRPALQITPRVKVTPLSCHCKLKALVPLLHHLLAFPEPVEEAKPHLTQLVPLTTLSRELTHP